MKKYLGTESMPCGRCHTCGTKLEDSPCPEVARCPWCGREHFVREHYQCAPDYGLEAAYEERFEME